MQSIDLDDKPSSHLHHIPRSRESDEENAPGPTSVAMSGRVHWGIRSEGIILQSVPGSECHWDSFVLSVLSTGARTFQESG